MRAAAFRLSASRVDERILLVVAFHEHGIERGTELWLHVIADRRIRLLVPPMPWYYCWRTKFFQTHEGVF